MVAAEQLKYTVSISYAQSLFKAGSESLKEHPSGVNIKYRYDFEERLGIITSFTYADSTYNYSLLGKSLCRADWNYLSLGTGPIYRLNEYISAYGLLGIARGHSKINISNNSTSKKNTSTLYGLGLQFNPQMNWAIDTTYEYSKLGNAKVGTWMVGIGYRF